MAYDVLNDLREIYRDLVKNLGECDNDDLLRLRELKNSIDRLYFSLRKEGEEGDITVEYCILYEKVKLLRRDTKFCGLRISPVITRRLKL